jgi:hypothetical protein
MHRRRRKKNSAVCVSDTEHLKRYRIVRSGNELQIYISCTRNSINRQICEDAVYLLT